MRYRLCSKVQHLHANELPSIIRSYCQQTIRMRPFQCTAFKSYVIRSRLHTGGYICRTLPKHHRRISISINTNNSRRQQHTQAVAENNGSHEDTIVEHREGQSAHTVKPIHDSAIGSAPRETWNSESGSPAVSKSTKASDHLLRIVGKFLPYATPDIRVVESLDHKRVNGGQDQQDTVRIELLNAEYKISCVEIVKIAETSQNALELTFERLAQSYVRDLQMRLGSNQMPGENVQAYSTQTLSETLELGNTSIDLTPVELKSPLAQNLELFRAQMYAGNEAIGLPKVWTHSGIAQRLARASADADIIRRAEQAGIGDALNKTSKVQELSVKKTRRSFELERVKDPNKIRDYRASISPVCMNAMLFALNRARAAGLPDEVQLEPWQGTDASYPQSERNNRAHKDWLSRKLKQEYIRNRKSFLGAIEREQEKLPIRKPLVVKQICHTVRQNDVLILISETGSGKTTQLPQILLQEAVLAGQGAMCNIICTQPRRIAATSVATRVAYEQGSYVGGFVGYHVRFDAKVPTQEGSINYSTAGVLLKRLQDDAEKILNDISHIVVDEVHERDLTVDLLLALLRDIMRTRRASGKPFPKLILMSATMESLDFERYFAEPYLDLTPRVTSIKIPGRAYPVSVNMLDDIVPQLVKHYADDKQISTLLRDSHQYLEWEDEFAMSWEESVHEPRTTSSEVNDQGISLSDSTDYGNPVRDATMPYQLITLTVIHALRSSENGDVLIFLPGMKEIDVLTNMLLTRMPDDLNFNDREKLRIFKLHSALYESNAEVFAPIPSTCRRVILATNIAQTSITLPGVVHVIDTGKRRDMAYDPISRKNEFTSTWIDQATSMQRRGRAGRVQNGHYWAMFTNARYQSLPKQAQPEMLTSDLTGPSLVLKACASEINLQSFFDRVLDPPGRQAVAACIQELQELGMLTSDEKITLLGKFCSDFPLHPAKARGLLLGLVFGCLKPLMITACHDVDSPLIHSATNRRDMYYSTLDFAGVSDDDRFAVVEAFLQYDQAVQDGSDEKIAMLQSKNIRAGAYRNMCTVGRQLYDIMNEYGLVPHGIANEQNSVFTLIPDSLNVNAHRVNLFKALALSVVDTNLAVWNESEKSWLVKDLKCMLKPYGVNTMQSLRLLNRTPYRMQGELVGFGGMVRNVITSPRPFLLETSAITPLMAMLFGGPIALVDKDTIEIDGWLRYTIDVESMQMGDDRGFKDRITPAQMIFEFRKMIDRYLTVAFSELRHMSSKAPAGSRRPLVLSRNSTLRKVMGRGLIAVLEADVQHWDEVTEIT